MRQRILLILGAAVAMLAVYTFLLRPRPSMRPVTADLRSVSEQLQVSVAAKAAVKRNVPKPAAPAAKAPEPAAASTAADTTMAKVNATAPLQPENWGSDPFVRDWMLVNELANLSLKAITLGGDQSYALINDQILQEGDEISGKRIVSIESDKVTLEQGGRTFTLLLGE